jgi:HSF-type DNA-binding
MSLLADKKSGGGPKTTFPRKLYEMVSSESKRNSTIIRFQPHGRAFKIYDREKFQKEVLRKYFQFQTEYASFQRQLNLYGFQRLTDSGPDQHAFYHCLFLRGRPDLCELILRNQQGRRKANQSQEPDFTTLAAMPDFTPADVTDGSASVDISMKSGDAMITNDSLVAEYAGRPAQESLVAMSYHTRHDAAVYTPNPLHQWQYSNGSNNLEMVAYGTANSDPSIAVPGRCASQSSLIPMETGRPESLQSQGNMDGRHPTLPSQSGTYATSSAPLQQWQHFNRSTNFEAVTYGSAESAPPTWNQPSQRSLIPMAASRPEPLHNNASMNMAGSHPTQPSWSSTNSNGQLLLDHQLENAILQLGPEDVSQVQIRSDEPLTDLLDMTTSSGSDMAMWLRDIDLE